MMIGQHPVRPLPRPTRPSGAVTSRARGLTRRAASRRASAAVLLFSAVAFLLCQAPGHATAQPVCGADILPGDVLLSQLGGNLVRIDPNGDPMRPPTEAVDQLYISIAYSPDGRLIGNRADQIIEIDLESCEETVLSEGGSLADAPDMIVVGNLLYAVEDHRSVRGVIEVDLLTGAQRLVTSSAGLTFPRLLNPRGITAGENQQGQLQLFVAALASPIGGTDGRIVRVDPNVPFNPSDPEANQTVIAQGSNAYPLPDGAEAPKEYAEMQDTLAITIDGTDLLVTDQSRIMRFDQDGNLLSTTPIEFGLTFANDLEIYPGGGMIVPGHDFYLSVKAVLRVTLGGSPQAENLTDGYTALAQPRGVAIVPEPAEQTCGDADRTGTVTATDALAILKAAVGAGTCDSCLCDVDDSGSLTATDALRALQHAVGIGVELFCPVCA